MSLLPSNATPLEIIYASVEQAARNLPVELIQKSKSFKHSASRYLAFLAYEESADVWDEAWSEAQKRSWISSQWSLHRRKGTAGAVKDALAALGYGASIEEWYAYGGAPYHFRVAIDLRSRSSWRVADYKQIYTVCINAKPVRAMLEEIRGAIRDTMPEPVIAIAGHATISLEFDWSD